MGGSAIVLHSSWRGASTYVWAKFRGRPDTYCYFEPLSEELATLTADAIDRFRPWSFAHHPPLDRPYLDEFRPLLGTSVPGVPAFPAPLAYGRYRADRRAELPELAAYFATLARLAEGFGKRPVYGLVRSSLRVDWFRAHVPGSQIFIRRAGRRQFVSILRQAVKGNPYFLQRGPVILHLNRDEPAFAPLLAAFDVPAMLKSFDPSAGSGATFAWQPFLPQFYAIFHALHRLAERDGERASDLVLDIDRLSDDVAYRRAIEDQAAALTGIPVSFADCAVERYQGNLGWSSESFDELENWVEAMMAGSV
jgi:hypothetical protein